MVLGSSHLQADGGKVLRRENKGGDTIDIAFNATFQSFTKGVAGGTNSTSQPSMIINWPSAM